jgi:hypothetical protein
MATPYSFTQPIRYYKANDPYYYEVDNIPLRQLEENILYVKGLIENTTGGSSGSGGSGGSGYLTANSEIDITNIKQLKPKAGGGRTVSVNAGRFVSRINDAFDIAKPLNKLVFGNAPTSTQVGIPPINQLWTEANRNAVWDAFVGSTAASKAYNVNGLESWYTFHSTPGTMGNAWATTYGAPYTRMYPHYEGAEGYAAAFRWPGPSNVGHLSPTVWGSVGYTVDTLPTVHLSFVQMWRGVFRTSVVEFPDASIEIPAWDDNDFYYRDDNDQVVQITADQRIDLLVAYSLPIDSSSTTINNYETGFCNGSIPSPKTLTTPTLGLVRGAGIGIEKNNQTNPVAIETLEGCESPAGPAGSARITANASDKEGTANVGIKRINGSVVHGSFPSPDDLLNNAPTLALGVEKDAWGLIGQAALPLAYVVVTKGQATITANDIIDIRPFLRTTEFTYNERAGIAAANPPLSFANPAVGAFQLQAAIDATIAADTAGEAEVTSGRAIYTDYVMGGLAYGVEGTLLTMCDGPQGEKDPFGSESQQAAYTDPYSSVPVSFAEFTSSKNYLDNTDQFRREAFLQYIYTDRQTDLKRWLSDPNSSFSQNTHTYLGLPEGDSGRNIPLFPEWDMPMNGTNYLNLMGQGPQGSTAAIPKPTWWMWFESADTPNRTLAYVPGAVTSTKETGSPFTYLEKAYQWGVSLNSEQPGSGMVNTCTKKLEVTFPSWCNSYDVLVEYVNCGPLTQFQETSPNDRGVGLGSGLNINKGPVVSFPSGEKKAVIQINSNAQNLPDGGTGFTQDGDIKDKIAGPNQASVGQAYEWLSYVISLPQFTNNKFGTDNQQTSPNNTMRFTPKFGAAFYPTVKFTIIGYTEDPVSKNAAYNQTGNNFTLIQDVLAGNSSIITGVLGPVNGTSKIDIQDM